MFCLVGGVPPVLFHDDNNNNSFFMEIVLPPITKLHLQGLNSLSFKKKAVNVCLQAAVASLSICTTDGAAEGSFFKLGRRSLR